MNKIRYESLNSFIKLEKKKKEEEEKEEERRKT